MKIERTASLEQIRPRTPRRGARLFAVVGFGLAIAISAGSDPAPIRAAQLKSAPLPASAPKLSDHEIEALPSMSPQQQAQLLLDRAINPSQSPIDLINQTVPTFYRH